jgi:ABC-2 type transport system permease protein
MLVFLPTKMLSGDTPLESEPYVLQIIMQDIASTHFVSLAEAILFRGAGMKLVFRDYLTVAGLGALFFVVSVLCFRRSVATPIEGQRWLRLPGYDTL